jgi:hypothetical protein
VLDCATEILYRAAIPLRDRHPSIIKPFLVDAWVHIERRERGASKWP